MVNKFANWLICATLMLSPFVLEAKSACKRDFKIGSYKAEITAHYSKTRLTTNGALLIVLSDGSRWKVKSNLSAAELQQKIESSWKMDDDIRLDDADDECPAAFLLKNAKNGHVYMVDLDSDLEEGATAVTISKIDKNGYALMTTDGRQWAIGWLGSFTSSSWRAGDKLLINKSYYSNSEDYTLINLNDKETVWASIVTW